MGKSYEDQVKEGSVYSPSHRPPAGTIASQQKERLDEQQRRSSGGGGGGGCFPAGTRIAAPGGPISIEQLRPGDAVSSLDRRTGTLGVRRILNIQIHDDNPTWRLQLVNGGTVTTTGHHSFLVGGNTWRRAEQIRPGDVVDLLGPQDRRTASVVAVSEPAGTTEVVYNLVIEQDFNFFAEGVLAHSFTRLRALQILLWTLIGSLSLVGSEAKRGRGDAGAGEVVLSP